MIEIKQQLVSESIINQRSYGYGNPINYIVVHQTGNTNKGANAQAHANIQSKLNPREASWHYSVDDVEIIQSFPDSVKCWATGDGKGRGNSEGVQIELCINSDGDYKKTVENGAKLVRFLLDKYKLGIDRVKQHYDFTPKNCPAQLRAGKDEITWDDFLDMVNSFKDSVQHVNNPKPSAPSKPQPSSEKYEIVKDIPGYYTSVDAKTRKNNRTTVKKGSYFVFNKADGMVNVTSKSGIAGSWINPNDNKVLNQQPSKSATNTKLGVGSKVILSKNATKYATGENIPSSIKGKQYTIMQLKSDRALLKEIYSWVLLKDIGGSSSTPTKSTPKKSISQMADEIINNPKVPTGHENRRKWLGITKEEYEKVRVEVNKRLK